MILLACALPRERARRRHAAHHSVHVIEWVVVLHQHIQLLLREVANVEAAPLQHLTTQGFDFARNGFNDGGFTLSVGTQNANAFACQNRLIHVLHNDFL